MAEGAARSAHAPVARQVAPTLHQRELGLLLGSLRVERGLSVEEVAEKLLCSSSRIWQLEAAADLPTATDLRALRTLLKLDDATADQLTDLVREARQQGWWIHYEDLGVPYLGLEQHASAITSYTMAYLPALLQTEEYARAIITTIAPQMESKILEERIEARLRRQHVLGGENPLRYTVLLDEAALHRSVGGQAVMREQLDKALTMIRARSVDLRVVPFERGTSVAQDNNFVLLQFGESGPSPVVYVEALTAYHFLEEKQDVDRYLEEIERLRRSALNIDDSVQCIERVRDAYRVD